MSATCASRYLHNKFHDVFCEKWEYNIICGFFAVLEVEVSAEKKEQTVIISSTGCMITYLFTSYSTVVFSLQHLGEKIWFVDCSGAKNLSQFPS